MSYVKGWNDAIDAAMKIAIGCADNIVASDDCGKYALAGAGVLTAYAIELGALRIGNSPPPAQPAPAPPDAGPAPSAAAAEADPAIGGDWS